MRKLIDRIMSVAIAAIVLLFVALVPLVWNLPESEDFLDGL